MPLGRKYTKKRDDKFFGKFLISISILRMSFEKFWSLCRRESCLIRMKIVAVHSLNRLKNWLSVGTLLSQIDSHWKLWLVQSNLFLENSLSTTQTHQSRKCTIVRPYLAELLWEICTCVVRKIRMIVEEHPSVNMDRVEHGIILTHPLRRDGFSTAEYRPTE